MKKLIILATAVAALAAFVVPTTASAYTSKWKDGGAVLTENGTITITGTAAFTGGTTCHVHVHGTLTAGTGTGSLSTFNASECEPTETLAALGCEEVEVTTEGLPWMADDEGTKVKITGVHITNHYTGGPFCPSTVTISDDASGGAYLTPNNTSAMSSGTLSGSVSTSLGTQEVSGSGTVTLNSGTYGL